MKTVKKLRLAKANRGGGALSVSEQLTLCEKGRRLCYVA